MSLSGLRDEGLAHKPEMNPPKAKTPPSLRVWGFGVMDT